MINGKKVIGLCITRINDSMLSDCVDRIIKEAAAADYRVIVFNSYVDFYNGNCYDRGAASIYGLVNFDTVDVVLVVQDTFVEKSIPDGIISRAKERGVPVVVLNGSADGCVCVKPCYVDALKSVMNHVIKHHGVTDTFFMAGKRGDAGSEERTECYREVLRENGLPPDESRIDYGEYWDRPTAKVMKRMFAGGRKMPKAIFCANDLMAFTVCNELKKHGYRVPEDVIVTGFDGVAEVGYFNPRLTTCTSDPDTLAQLCIEGVKAAVSGNNTAVYTYSFNAHFAESCGCDSAAPSDGQILAAELLRSMHEMQTHEDFEYDWIDNILDMSDITDLYETIKGCMLENSYACLNNDFKAMLTEPDYESKSSTFSDKLIIIASDYNADYSAASGSMPLYQLIPENEWKDGSVFVLSSIYIGETVVGYYAVRTTDIKKTSRSAKRVLKTMNIAFNVALNYFRQVNMTRKAEKIAITNTVTGLPNLKGALKWFESFAADSNNREIPISVSVYGLPKYSYILENTTAERMLRRGCALLQRHFLRRIPRTALWLMLRMMSSLC